MRRPFPGNRPSALDISLYCPLPGRLATGAAGRAAFVSSVYHALKARDPKSASMLCQLTPDEREDVMGRHDPTDIVFEDGRALRWADALHETTVGLTRALEYCEPGSPEVWSQGTADAHWKPIGDIVYVADLKATERTSHVDSLQLHAYGWALSSKLGVDCYCPGIWAATEGVWCWGEIVEKGTWEADEIADRLKVAIGNTKGPACLGPHCESCWSRLKCPEYVMPGVEACADLAKLACPSEMTHPEAARLVQLISKAEAVIKAAKDTAKVWSRQQGGVRDEASGKMWKGCETQGRETVDIKGLREALGTQAEQFIKRGEPFDTFRWVNIPGQKKARKK